MSNSGKPFTTVTLEDRTFAVVRTDPRKPQFLEVIALFLDASRARGGPASGRSTPALVFGCAARWRCVRTRAPSERGYFYLQHLVDGGCSRGACTRGFDELFLLQRLQNRMQ